MAVYTDVSDADLSAFLTAYDIGTALSFKGVAEGVENSNFLLHTSAGNYFLTLYERRVNVDDLPFFLKLMRHLAARGVACPLPVAARDGEALRHLCGRPAAIITFLNGVSVREPGIDHCAAVGAALAGLHQAAADFDLDRANALSLAGWRHLAQQTAGRADEIAPGLGHEIATALRELEVAWPQDLPKGVIHADLFPDNVLFLGDTVSGLIDFYFSCSDFFAYDLAVLINAWCFNPAHVFEPAKACAMVDAYRRVRPLSGAEQASLVTLARGAALRFLLTRLYDWLNQVPGALVKPKDPLEYLAKLRHFTTAGALACLETKQ
jgi:homoserine kinase type II